MHRSPSTPLGAVPPLAAELQRAMALHRRGASAEAEAVYRRALSAHPADPRLSSMLALLLLQAGRLDDALSVLDAALAKHARVAELHNSRGLVLAHLGQPDLAERAYRKAIALRPDLADAHTNLGVTLQRLGRTAEALSSYARALELKPDSAGTHNNIANALRQAGRLKDAADAYGRALALRPDMLNARAGRAAVLVELDRLDLAEADFQALRAAAPDETRHALGLADLLVASGRYDEARGVYDDLLKRVPGDAEASLGLARIAEAHGQFDLAEATYRQAASSKHARVEALAWLAEHAKAATPGLREQLEAIAADTATASRDRAAAHYGLTRILARQQDYDEAFASLRLANAFDREDQHRRGHVFDEAANAQLVERLKAAFDRASFDRTAGWGQPTEQPIFIVGMPRSGTTLCEQILASHPLVQAGGERREIAQIVRRLPREISSAGDLTYPECIASLSPETARRVADDYCRMIEAQAPTAARFTDKMPLNFRQLGLIAILLPGARVIHCRRDPVDTCFSCHWQAFAAPMPWKTDLKELAAFYGAYDSLMAHWRQTLPVKMLDFAYEEVVSDFEGSVRRLLDFCGLPWEPRCLQFHQTARPVATASSRQVREGLRPRTELWRPYAAHLAPLLEGLGATGMAR